jgi:hypothetical protein
MYFFQKLNEFSHGNNVLDTPTSSPGGVLVSNIYASYLTWVELFGKKEKP